MDAISLLLIGLLLLLPLLLFRNYSKDQESIETILKIPGPKLYPFFGNFIELFLLKRSDLVKYDSESNKKYGPVYKIFIFNLPLVHFSSPEGFEVLLSGMKHLEKGFPYNILQGWLGQGLLTSKGIKWQKHRKMITPTFHFKILEQFHEVMVDKSNILLKILEKESSAGQVVNVVPYITNCTLDIICETAMGTNINAQENIHSEYVASINKLGELLMERLIKPWQSIEKIYKLTPTGREWYSCLKILHGFTERVIKERKEIRKHNPGHTPTIEDIDLDLGKKKKVAFLDLLLDVADKDSSLTDKDIREEVDTFMFEGHDTTTMALCWTIFLLGHHQEIQERAYQEQVDLFNGEDRNITMRDITDMKYLERIIKESLRLYPSVPDIVRMSEQDIEIHGYTIPAGTNIALHAYQLHRNPKYFPNPEEFNPDNFLPENMKGRHPYAYLPFSAGPRNCIGQKFAMLEEKTILASIIRRFKITSLEKPENVEMVTEMVLRPQNGLKIKLEKRQ